NQIEEQRAAADREHQAAIEQLKAQFAEQTEARRIEFGLIERSLRSKNGTVAGKLVAEPFPGDNAPLTNPADNLLAERVKPQNGKRRGLKAKLAAAGKSRSKALAASKKAAAKKTSTNSASRNRGK
ncbi:MAG: hypothetical protein EBX60_08215, partial [Betaproteobacteria bacterium]|nr:hypothetical protein [Betaproteobacteria bacterium]